MWLGGVAALLLFSAYFMRTRPLPLEMGAPERTTVREYITEEAKTRLGREYLLSAPVAGTLQRIDLEPGDLVAAGQVVARFDPLPFEQQIRAIEARIAQAKAQIEGVDIAKPKPESLEMAATRAKELMDAVRASDHDLAAARAAAEEARKAQERAIGMLAKGVISQAEVDAAQLRLETATQALARASAAADATRKGARIGDLDARRLSGSINDNEFMREVYTAEVEALDAQLAIARDDLQKSELRAPVEGPLLDKFLPDTQVVAPGTPLVRIGDLSTIEIECDVLSEEVGRVSVGDTVELLGKALGQGGATGKVKRIYPSAFMKISALGVEQQRVKVLIDFDNTALQMRPGTRLDVRIVTGEQQNALAIPERAAFRREGQWYVFVVENDVARQVPITIGLRNDLWAEITDGLQEGVTIITEPINELTDGAAVLRRE